MGWNFKFGKGRRGSLHSGDNEKGPGGHQIRFLSINPPYEVVLWPQALEVKNPEL